MDSSVKRSKMKHVKSERNSVIVNGKVSNSTTKSAKQVSVSDDRLRCEFKSSVLVNTTFTTIEKAIKVEMCDEAKSEAVCIPANSAQPKGEFQPSSVSDLKFISHLVSPTMDIRPVQLHETETSFHASSFTNLQQPLRLERGLHVIDREHLTDCDDHDKLWTKMKWNPTKLRRATSSQPTGVKKASRRVHTNNRERQRQQDVSDAFQELRAKIPTEPIDKKLSKCTILTRAIEYIKLLNRILDSYDQELQRTTVVSSSNGRDHYLNQCDAPSRDRAERDSSSPSSFTSEGSKRCNCKLDESPRKRFKVMCSEKCKSVNESSNEYEFESSSLEVSSPSTMSSPSDID